MYTALKARPGIDVEMTPLLNEAGWSFSSAVRFFNGMVQKLGGWTHLNQTKLTGQGRGLHAWADTSGNPYAAAGTEQRLSLFASGTLYDITPIRATTNPAVNFSTVINTPTITIVDPGHGAAPTDWINVYVPVSVGGLIIMGFYQIQTVIDANTYTITAAANATATVANGGAVPSFTTANASPNVSVNFNNHGLVVNNPFVVQVLTNVGGFALSGFYSVFSVTDANHFVIQPGGNGNANTTLSENGGNAQIQYLIHTGLVSAQPAVLGYGQGIYGQGIYGGAQTGNTIAPLREWFPDNFGQDLVCNYTGSPLYLWVPPVATGNVAIPINTTNFPLATNPPKQVNVSFVTTPQRMVVCLGCDDPVSLNFDPLLVRWCDAGDFTQWAPTSANQAGTFHIPSGSALRGGISAPNFNVLWTDIDMWLMTYLGGTGLAQDVWGFNKVASAVDLFCARGAAVYRNLVFWLSSNGFFVFDGNQVRPIPCAVWDKFWLNLNRLQAEKISAQVNSWFGEISWSFPSASGAGEVDARVTYNIKENSWTYDDPGTVTARTAWIDDNVYGAPIGIDVNGYMQQHEVSNDNDGTPLFSSARTGWFSAAEGSLVTMMERLSMDAIAVGGDQTLQITVLAQDYPTGPVRTYGPYTWNPTQGPPYQIVRARGRFFSIQVGSQGPGSFWRLGNFRYDGRKAGRRP